MSSKVLASVLHIEQSDFPQNLKLADITPVNKKNARLEKASYRPVSVLPLICKNFGKNNAKTN